MTVGVQIASMLSTVDILLLLGVATLGHVMAIIWLFSDRQAWKFCQIKIYDLKIENAQVRRELKNSLHTPTHAVLLLITISAGAFGGDGSVALISSVIVTFLIAEVWHFVSHRMMHTKTLHWIHAEHHKSRICSPFTAISFSFWEKIIFDLGIIIPLVILDQTILPIDATGVLLWFAGYLIINSYSHANFEFRKWPYPRRLGKFMTSTTYHALHHSRYTGNYGLGTRFLDRAFKTEWEDYEGVFERVTEQKTPLKRLKEQVIETD